MEKLKDTMDMSKEISSIPVLDEDLVTELRTMTKENLDYYLGDLLQEDYLEALWDRWNKVVNAIDRMSAKNRNMLVKRGNWNMETAKLFADKDNFYLHIGEMQPMAEPQQQENNTEWINKDRHISALSEYVPFSFKNYL